MQGFLLVLVHRNVYLNASKINHMLPKLKTSAKSVQTTAEVCADYTCSLQKVLRTYKLRYAHSLKQVRVSMNLFTCTHGNEYTVLTSVSTRTYDNEYTHLL